METYSAEEFEIQIEIPAPRRKRYWNFFRLTRCQRLHLTDHDKDESVTEPPQPPKKINVDDNNLAPQGGLHLQ